MTKILTGQSAGVLLVWAVALIFGGCAAKPEQPSTAADVVGATDSAADAATVDAGAGTEPAGEPGAEPGVEMAAEAPAESPQPAQQKKEKKKHAPGPCRVGSAENAPLIDDAHRKLYETLCGAALWFDGLFGERNEATVASARGVSGRLEISGLNSEYEGSKFRVRGNVRVDFPNLDKRFNAFIGRDDQDDFIRDRTEGLALRSQFLDFADENRWLAGLGYSLPGTYQQRTDFRVGGKLGSEPEIFVQGRFRKNWFINERNLFHFRETLFWTNRDGFGATTSFDFDHVVKRTMLLRWGNIGTVSEATDGLEWRSALLLYQSLNRAGRALAYEVFIRGESAWEVPLKEWGVRGVYRQPLMRRDWLAGEFVLGYSWPRFELEDEREGSLTVGLGLEILVGGWV
ncbi:MAG: hypothetical protein QG573_2899 [Acidobacteriota bacterium]|nr:hypothetical protein [Acidobacteriota bacterium]